VHNPNLSDRDLRELYRLMLLTRRFEEKINELYSDGTIFIDPHSSIGQELIVGVSYGLRRDDILMPYYRSRGAVLAKGVSPKTLMAEVFGKNTGLSKGKETYYHPANREIGVLLQTGIVGSQFPLATGIGLAIKLRESDAVVVCTFGDGAANRGDFHEGLNLAGIWKLPVVFVCENNCISISTIASKSRATQDIAIRSVAYGFPGVIVEDDDVTAVYKSTQDAVKRARDGEGPTLVDIRTCLWRPHEESLPFFSGALGNFPTRAEETREFMRHCPIRKMEALLLERRILTQDMIEKIDHDVRLEVSEAVEYAKKSEFPEIGETLRDVYSGS